MKNLLFVANWKMNMLAGEAEGYCTKFKAASSGLIKEHVSVAICPPFTAMQAVFSIMTESEIGIGAQNVHWDKSGAHTGEISTEMLKEFDTKYVILGHSERRGFYGETSHNVALKALTCINAAFTPIICVGDSELEYREGRSKEVVNRQLAASLEGISPEDASKIVIAYEPIWAIGTGLAATPEIAQGVHQSIRGQLVNLFGDIGSNILIIYGGSTKPENIAGLVSQSDISGALVGGASLTPDSFWSLIESGSSSC